MDLFAPIKEKIAQYFDVLLKLLKINVVEKSSFILSYFIFSFAGLFLLFCFFFLLSMGIAEAFVEMGISRYGAYFLTAGVYFVFILLLLMLRKSLTRGLANMFISMFTDSDESKQS